MNPYPKYKHSGIEWIGDLPQHWVVQRAKYIYHEVDERSKDDSETLLSVSEYYGVAPRETIREEGEWLTRADSLVGYKKCKANDLVMNIMLAWKRGLGVTDQNGIVSPAYAVFRLRDGVGDAKYFHYLLRTDLFTSEFHRNSTGIIDSRLRLYPDSFFDTRIIVPPVCEQQAIATYLELKTRKIDALIEKKQRLIECLSERRTAIINQAVTRGLNPNVGMKDSGVEWIGTIPAHWELRRLKDVVKGGLVNGLFKKREEFGQGTKLVNVSNIYKEDCIIDETELDRVNTTDSELEAFGIAIGDILFVRSSLKREGIAASACVKTTSEPMVYECHLIKISPDPKHADYRFLINYLSSSTIRNRLLALSNTTTMTTIDQPSLSTLQVLAPPLEEQMHIWEHIESTSSATQRAIQRTESEILLLQEYRSALISEVVMGKIDVRDYVEGKNN